jgi:hypothetical protein
MNKEQQKFCHFHYKCKTVKIVEVKFCEWLRVKLQAVFLLKVVFVLLYWYNPKSYRGFTVITIKGIKKWEGRITKPMSDKPVFHPAKVKKII